MGLYIPWASAFKRGVPVPLRNTTTDLMDEVKEANGISSDYRLAKLLDVQTTTISNYRKGRSQASDEIALKMTEMIKRAPAPVLAQIAAERASSPEVAKVWRDAAKVLARASR
jgi:predicted transcriptional regulator